MNSFTSETSLPEGLKREQPGSNLASLSLTPALQSIASGVVAQWQNRKAFDRVARFGIMPTNKLFFHGPPGNGKTTAAQWIAGKLEVSLYRILCDQLISSYLGQTANKMGHVMEWLERQKRGSVVLFDEIETIFPGREHNKSNTSRETNSAMAVLWQWLDRWQGPQIFIFATNMATQVDKALISRFEVSMEFGPPTSEQALEVIRYWQEALHEFGSDKWGPMLIDQAESDGFSSFRDLWKQVKWNVIEHINGGQK